MKLFSFITSFLESLGEFNKIKQLNKDILDIDRRVINSLYRPAIADDIFYVNSEQITWLNDDSEHRIDELVNSIEQLSNFYWEINPALSAALYGIWDSSQMILRRRTLIQIFFGNKKEEIKLFLNTRGLIVTATMRYANVKLFPIEVPNPYRELDSYRELANMTINNLSNLHKKSN